MKNVLFISLFFFVSCSKTDLNIESPYKEGVLEITYKNIKTVTPPISYSSVKLENSKLVFTDATKCDLNVENLNTFYSGEVVSFKIISEVVKNCP